ncbi:MAG: hypothetical protein Q8L15_16070 [Methylobacter sp.]|nr:hypothetical protein [Methylobacter sp.]
MDIENKSRLLIAIGIGLLFPLFFQLSGGVYNSAFPVLDSGGMLSALPLPISILACFGGILMLLGNYRRAFLGGIFVAGLLFVLLISLLFAEIGAGVDRRKIILIFQYLLPAFGLILGQMIVDDDKLIPRAFLYTLLVIVPVQLVCSWVQKGTFALTHNLYLFSIYSHIQFVPLIMVCAFSYSMVTLWENHKRKLFVLACLMLIYVLASASFLAIFAYVAFIVVFIGIRMGMPLQNIKLAIIFPVLVVVAVAMVAESLQMFYEFIGNHNIAVHVDGSYVNKFNELASGNIPQNVLERLDIWKLYIDAIAESTKTLILGHNVLISREVISSAHNWYLDITYAFGLLSLLPMSLLIGYTAYQLWQSKQTLSSETLWLAVIVFYLVIVDNNFKVTLRQPYPGIFAYFLWGLLLSQFPRKREQEREGI